MSSKKESLVILKEMLVGFKDTIVEMDACFKEQVSVIKMLVEEAEFEIMNDEKRKLLKRRIHEELCRKIEGLQREIAAAESKKE